MSIKGSNSTTKDPNETQQLTVLALRDREKKDNHYQLKIQKPKY